VFVRKCCLFLCELNTHSEGLKIIHRYLVSAEVEKSILKHACMAVATLIVSRLLLQRSGSQSSIKTLHIAFQNLKISIFAEAKLDESCVISVRLGFLGKDPNPVGLPCSRSSLRNSVVLFERDLVTHERTNLSRFNHFGFFGL
jgi:hypothetical protein